MSRAFVPVLGSALWIPNGRGTQHVHVVLAGPDTDKMVAIASITTDHSTPRTDRACFLDAGDHHFLNHRSYVLYADARLIDAPALTREVSLGTFRWEYPMSPEVTDRMVQGALTSPRTPRAVRTFVRTWHDL